MGGGTVLAQHFTPLCITIWLAGVLKLHWLTDSAGRSALQCRLQRAARLAARSWLLPFALLLALAGCGLVATAQPLATAAPALKLTLWVEWPVLRTDRPQVAHAVVASAQGERLRGVTVQGQLTRPGAEPLQLMFSVTDADGYATAVFPMFEAPDASETHRLVAQAATNADYGVAMIEYEVQP